MIRQPMPRSYLHPELGDELCPWEKWSTPATPLCIFNHILSHDTLHAQPAAGLRVPAAAL